MNNWDLMKQRKFQEAYEAFTREFEEKKRPPSLNNRALASLNLKRYREALEDYLTLIELNQGSSDGDFLFAGVCFWILGDPERAVRCWREGLDTPYSDAAGGVEIRATLLVASYFLDDEGLEKEATGLLKKLWKPKNADVWPAAIAGYLLDFLSEEDVLNSLSQQPTLHIRHRCQAEFYFAVKRLKVGDTTGFLAHLEACVATEYGYLEQEYYLAISELDKFHRQSSH